MKNYRENNQFIFDNPFKKHDFDYWMQRAIHLAKCVVFRGIIMVNKPRNVQEKKYNVSICAIFKNESRNIREWIEFHRIVGVEHFYMYNNNSEDDYKAVLDQYINEGIVTLIEWPYPQAQSDAFENCIETFSHETKWMGFIDLDEFVIPQLYENIYDILKNFNNKPAVLMYWKVFGSSGLIDRPADSLVTETFTTCFSKLQDIGKCFYNTSFSYTKDDNVSRKLMMYHEFWAQCNPRRVPPVNVYNKISFGRFHRLGNGNVPIHINHYVTKTYAEYIKKSKGTDAVFATNPRNESKFYHIDALCTSVDYSAFGYLTKLKKSMEETKCHMQSL